jgi:tRNA pseudouridine13 synthase
MRKSTLESEDTVDGFVNEFDKSYESGKSEKSEYTHLLRIAEEKVGITEYISRTPGIGGVLKEEPEFFTVYEVPSLPEIIEIGENGGQFMETPDISNTHLIIRVKKRNWDTINFARHIARRLGISQKRIGYAGTKDKRAVTVQYYSIKNVNRSSVESISIRDSEISVVGYSRRGLSLGDLMGNYFKIRVVDLSERDERRIGKILEELRERGIPNYFGTQRFGSIRYITHIVGLYILKRDYESAFWTYVAYPFEYENEAVRKIREDLWDSRDPKVGLKELPKYLRYERNLLQKLIEKGSEEKALLTLPKNLKMMFVHAYQSYIFNRLISQRIRDFEGLKEIEKSDIVDFVKVGVANLDFAEGVRFYQPLGEPVIAGEHWKRVNYLRQEKIALLSLPLPGYGIDIPKESWSSRIFGLLEEDGISLGDFKHEYPEFSSSGEFRMADMPVELDGFRYHFCSDNSVLFEFFLPRGCYATSLLREFMK